MRSRVHAVALPSEAGEFTDDLRRIFLELGRTADQLTGECSPAIDVFETDEAVEIVMDAPGMSADAVHVAAKGSAILIAGVKSPRRERRDTSFHLVERGYGRFARVVRLTAPCDTSRARARVVNGELRLAVPKVAERRNVVIPIPIEPQDR